MPVLDTLGLGLANSLRVQVCMCDGAGLFALVNMHVALVNMRLVNVTLEKLDWHGCCVNLSRGKRLCWVAPLLYRACLLADQLVAWYFYVHLLLSRIHLTS